jgi:hypothetical protein
MKRFITLAMALVLVTAIASTALAGQSRARTWKATLKPVTADPAQTTPKGKAQAVVNKKKGKISIHVKGLVAGTTYAWHIHDFPADSAADYNPCAVGAEQGAIHQLGTADYKPLTANADGNGSGKGSKFTLDPTKQYYVNVHGADGAPISCGVLTTKKAKAPKSTKGQAKSHTHS